MYKEKFCIVRLFSLFSRSFPYYFLCYRAFFEWPYRIGYKRSEFGSNKCEEKKIQSKKKIYGLIILSSLYHWIRSPYSVAAAHLVCTQSLVHYQRSVCLFSHFFRNFLFCIFFPLLLLPKQITCVHFFLFNMLMAQSISPNCHDVTWEAFEQRQKTRNLFFEMFSAYHILLPTQTSHAKQTKTRRKENCQNFIEWQKCNKLFDDGASRKV